MKHKRIEYTKVFRKNLKKFPKSQYKFLIEREKIFRENPFDPRLKTHKLSGKLAKFYSFSVSYHWRIIFHVEENNVVIFDNIGTHEVYK